MAGQVYAIASGKGGVGKTTTVVNLGVVLRRADHTVALVDADLGMANLGPMLGVSGELTIHDVLSGAATVEEALVEEAPGFAVLAGSESLTDYPDADPGNLGDVLDTLAESYDFVLVDTGAGMSHEDVLPLGLADRVLLVTSPDPTAFGDTRKTAELAALAEGDIAGLVVTKAEAETDAEHVASEVGVDLIGVIPYDSTVRESTASGRPLEATDPDAPAAAAYRELAGRIGDGSGEPLPHTPGKHETVSESTNAVEDEESEPVTADDDAGDDGSNESGPPAEESEADSPAPEPSTDEEDAVSEEAPSDDSTAGVESEPDEQGSAGVPGASDGTSETGGDPEERTETEEDYLAEFEDIETESKGGILSRIGRMFR